MGIQNNELLHFLEDEKEDYYKNSDQEIDIHYENIPDQIKIH